MVVHGLADADRESAARRPHIVVDGKSGRARSPVLRVRLRSCTDLHGVHRREVTEDDTRRERVLRGGTRRGRWFAPGGPRCVGRRPGRQELVAQCRHLRVGTGSPRVIEDAAGNHGAAAAAPRSTFRASGDRPSSSSACLIEMAASARTAGSRNRSCSRSTSSGHEAGSTNS